MIDSNIIPISAPFIGSGNKSSLINIKVFRGFQIRQIVSDLAQLYHYYKEWPYLCQPDSIVDVEDVTKKYGNNPHAIVCAAYEGDQIIGAAMGMNFHGDHGIASGWFVEPLTKEAFPERTFYFGDILVKPEYRNKKIGTDLYKSLEGMIRETGIYDQIAIALVHRELPFLHFSPPANYYSLTEFWEQKFSYEKMKNGRYHWIWNLVGLDKTYKHPMDFWVKKL